jgi:cysteine desulfurase
MDRIYLDHNATTRPDPAVREEMLACLDDVFGNPSSLHWFGQEARRIVDRSRKRVSKLIGAAPHEIIFTSGGTESNNQAVCGIAEHFGDQKRHIITTAIEHQALLHPCSYMEQRGFEVTYLPVDENGLLDPQEVGRSLREDTALVSVMMANNDVGTIQPLAEVSAMAKARGVLVHTDAVQAVGKIPVNVEALGVDLLSFSGHKLYGPKGIGALYVRQGTPLQPILYGGHQERRLRAGTENVPAIAGFGKACELATERVEQRDELIRSLRDRFESLVLERIDEVRINGHNLHRLPNTSNLSFAGVDGEMLAINLDLAGIAVSTGAACSSADHEPSHVLVAMGRTAEEALSSVRFSFGLANISDDVSYIVDALEHAVAGVRQFKIGTSAT